MVRLLSARVLWGQFCCKERIGDLRCFCKIFFIQKHTFKCVGGEKQTLLVFEASSVLPKVKEFSTQHQSLLKNPHHVTYKTPTTELLQEMCPKSLKGGGGTLDI